MAKNYYAEEQFRMISQVYAFLSDREDITIEDYIELTNLLGNGMLTRLRLFPDKKLTKRLSHLFALCECAYGEKPLHTDQILLSIEALNPTFSFDCDLVLEIKDTTYLIDFTSDDSYDNLINKTRVLEQKSKDPSLQHLKVDTIVHVYKPKRFYIDFPYLCSEPSDDNPASHTFHLLENLIYRSENFNTSFINNCDRVLEYAQEKISQIGPYSKNYSFINANPVRVQQAKIAASSNNMKDIIALFTNTHEKCYQPYIDALKEITAQHHTIKMPFKHRDARLTKENKDLQEVLYRLSDDPLAKLLHRCIIYPRRIFAIKSDCTIDELTHFPLKSKNSKMINFESEYVYSASNESGHFFKIYFSLESMDKQLRRVLLHEKFPSLTVPKGSKASLNEVAAKLAEAQTTLSNTAKIINKRIEGDSHSTIWDKIITISNLSKDDTGNLGRTASNLINSTSYTLAHSTGGSLISHYYEISKTIAASIKSSKKGETYYVGINGPYESVTITKISSTQDSFKRTHYSVISKDKSDTSSDDIVWNKHIRNKNVSRSHFRTIDHNELAYCLRLPYYINSLLTWDIETSLEKGRFSKSNVAEQLTNSILHCLVNRDVFSQAAQQVRYLYTSSIGYGANPAAIVDKFNFITPIYNWEYIYLARMIKLGLSLSLLRDTASLNLISKDGELQVVFPHTSFVAKSFSQTVSSMYYCNIFNKFRSFHEISEAACYNELDEEDDIYESCKKSNPDFITGFSSLTKKRLDDYDYLLSEKFVENECLFVDELIAAGPGRFRASVPIIISAARKYINITDDNVKEILFELGKSPIEACSMRGSMNDEEPNDKPQGIRAASAILEQFVKQYDIEPSALNKSSWLHSVLMENIEKQGGDSSIAKMVINQLIDKSVKYYYRIVQKDQIGNREISVLNAVFRLGALFIESISRVISKKVSEVDILEVKDKDYVFETAVKNSVRKSKEKSSIICYDNTDQKRWGPNHMLNFLSSMLYGALYKESGILRVVLVVADKVLHKQAKFPESLINLFKKYVTRNFSSVKITRDGVESEMGSNTLKTFFDRHSNDLFSGIFSKTMPYGMCQGIFHSTSSVYHAIMCKFIEDICFQRFSKSVSVKSFCTSDDSSRIINLSPKLERITTIRIIHNIIVNSGILFNIIRNESKSTFSFYIAEFNSIFFKNGLMATPSLKQRISKIDCGEGSNHVEDYLTCLSASANYFSIGGSYSGSLIISILNLTLHTEQWSRWDFASKEYYYLPVELGGFPVIEPFSTLLSGAVSNFFLRARTHVDSHSYAKLFSSIITEEPTEIKLNDYFRVPKILSEDSSAIKIYKSSGALGIHSLVRTNKKLSQFERRHSISKWEFPDHFLTLRHTSSDSRFFLYNIYKNGSMSLNEESLGVNSFYKRFSDPWVSRTRRCVKISKRSVFRVLGLNEDSNYSYDEINNKFSQIHLEDASDLLSKIIALNPLTSFSKNLIEQLIPRLKDADQILQFINSQECAEYIEPKFQPSTSRVTLRGHQALDQEKYTADLIKVLAGESARTLISEFYNDHRKFNHLPSSEDCPNIPLKDAILVAENSVLAFNKYIKRDTKMITSGEPDSLTSLVIMTLKSRFFEGIGVRLTGSLEIIGDRAHAFAYTSWFKKLSEQSAKYTETIVANSCRQLYSDVVKFGIITDKHTLSTKDHFEIAEVPTTRKHVKISAMSRSSLGSFAKSWVGSDASFSLDYNTTQAFLSGQLLNRNEYRTGEYSFSRNCTNLYFDVSVNSLKTLHLIETVQDFHSTNFTHIFLCESTATNAMVDITLTEIGEDRSWAKNIKRSVDKLKYVRMNRLYSVDKSKDHFIFKTIDVSTNFTMDVCKFSATIALELDGYKIPLCYSIPHSVPEVKLGYTLNHFDIIPPVEAYCNILDTTDDLRSIPPTLLKAIEFIVYQSHSSSNLKYMNNKMNEIGVNLNFTSAKQYDVFRSLLLDDKFTSKTVNTTKLFQYVNNMFKSSSVKNNYLTSMSIEDRLSLSLDNVIIDSDEESDLEDLGDENLIYQEHVSLDAERESEGDENIDISEFQKLMDDISEIDFEAFDDDDLLDVNEGLFEAFDIDLSEDLSDQVSIKSSRTGITINPSNEFPYFIAKSIREWYSKNVVTSRLGLPPDINHKSDVVKAYINSYRLSTFAPSSLFSRITGAEEISLPCPLSDLVVMKTIFS